MQIHQPFAKFVASLAIVFVLAACAGTPTTTSTNEASAPTQQSDSQTEAQPEDPAEAEDAYCQGNPPTVGLVDERPSPVYFADSGERAEYAYREFLQIPVGMAWGPDGRLYIGDWAGRHIVVVEPDGSLSDLGVWQHEQALRNDGPRGLAFDSQGCLYVNNHSQIFQVDISTGYAQVIGGIQGSPIGSITIGPDDELYYTDRGQGAVRKWLPPNDSETIVEGLPFAENLVFDAQGNLYVTQMQLDTVLKVDVTTGEVSQFRSGVCAFDPCFLAVDADGDIWARGIFYLSQISPDGELKPYSIDGVQYGGQSDGWHTAAGIAFDDEGGLYIASYNSYLKRLEPVETEGEAPAFTLTEVSPGFEASDLAVDSTGNLYAVNENQTEVLRISPDGIIDSVLDYESRGRVGIAVSPQDVVYLGMPDGQLYRLEADGSASLVASVPTRRMVFAGDGQLYAVVGNYGQAKSVVRVGEDGSLVEIASSIEGIALGNGEAHIAPAAGDGLYLFTEQERNLFYLDFEGSGHLITNLSNLGGGGPVDFAASPTTGEIFYVPHGPYEVYRISPDGSAQRMLSGVYGDPWGMVVSQDGQWLYIAESGAIDKIPIP